MPAISHYGIRPWDFDRLTRADLILLDHAMRQDDGGDGG